MSRTWGENDVDSKHIHEIPKETTTVMVYVILKTTNEDPFTTKIRVMQLMEQFNGSTVAYQQESKK